MEQQREGTGGSSSRGNVASGMGRLAGRADVAVGRRGRGSRPGAELEHCGFGLLLGLSGQWDRSTRRVGKAAESAAVPADTFMTARGVRTSHRSWREVLNGP